MKSDSQIQFLKELGLNLREIRNARGFTMEQLAGDTNIEIRQLSRIEHGEISTTVWTLKRLADALGVDLAQLLPATFNNKE